MLYCSRSVSPSPARSRDWCYPDALIVDDGEYVIPGLWDMHTHAFAADGVESYFKLLLANGVTGTRQPGISLADADREREAVEAGTLPGPPRMSWQITLWTGRDLKGQGDCLPVPRSKDVGSLTRCTLPAHHSSRSGSGLHR